MVKVRILVRSKFELSTGAKTIVSYIVLNIVLKRLRNSKLIIEAHPKFEADSKSEGHSKLEAD